MAEEIPDDSASDMERKTFQSGNASNSERSLVKEDNSSDKQRDVDETNIHYEGDVCIYTDPESSYQYEWDKEKNEWIPRSDIKETNKLATESGSESSASEIPKPADSNQEYHFDGESYVYTDSSSGVTYKYDTEQNSWVVKESDDKSELSTKRQTDTEESEDGEEVRQPVKQDMSKGTYGFEGDTHTYTDPVDGSVYIWDRDKNAWFPKIDDDFLARYQLSYGFTDTAKEPEKPQKTAEEEQKEKEEADEAKQEALKRKAAPQEPSWFELDEQHNTKVYVSNLPSDITEQEFIDVMQKCGLVMRDIDTGKMKVKLYSDPATGQLKGDGLCTYIKIESVDLALKLLDGYDLRGHKLSVERARFQMKGDYNPSLKPKKRRKKDKEKIKKIQEKLFAWQPDKLRGERAKHERVVIIKNLFDPQIFDKDVALLLEYQQELREECLKCGDVRRVVIYDRHPEGVGQVTFKEPEEADVCIQLLNGRWYNQRKITAETWDGKTKYKVVETEEEVQKRLKKWEQYLESEERKKEGKESNEDDKNSIPKDEKGDDSVMSSGKEDKNKTDNKKDSDSAKCFDDENDNKSDDSWGDSDANTEDEDNTSGQ